MGEWKYEMPKFECDEINADLLIYAPWSGHRNFIYDFVEYYKPKNFIELGSHYGCSSFAVLQAIKDFEIETEFYAIDTWEGDSLTVYGKTEHVYDSYKSINDKIFQKQKSYMLRMTFDEAVQQFKDGSVNVIHIDGSHEYKDVKHDYEMWKNKMSKDGIMLFHDISADKVLGNTMGSHVFWKELKKEQPYTCEFDFSYGLGIVFLNEIIYKDFLEKVDMQKYQRINNELAVNYKDVIRKKYFELIDKANWVESLQKDKEILDDDNKRLVQEIEKVKQVYEKSICEMKQYIENLEETAQVWKKEVDHIKHDYEITIQQKDKYISELEKRLTSESD